MVDCDMLIFLLSVKFDNEYKDSVEKMQVFLRDKNT